MCQSCNEVHGEKTKQVKTMFEKGKRIKVSDRHPKIEMRVDRRERNRERIWNRIVLQRRWRNLLFKTRETLLFSWRFSRSQLTLVLIVRTDCSIDSHFSRCALFVFICFVWLSFRLCESWEVIIRKLISRSLLSLLSLSALHHFICSRAWWILIFDISTLPCIDEIDRKRIEQENQKRRERRQSNLDKSPRKDETRLLRFS